MSKLRVLFKYWVPIALWSLLIFTASGDQESAQRSSRIIGPLVRWLFPDLPDTSVNIIVAFVRKCAHVTEYAILAWLFWRAVRKPIRNDPRPWNWREAFYAWVFVLVYAATDEIHQTFVPSRQGSIWDVLIDVTGGVLGLLALRLIGRWRKRW